MILHEGSTHTGVMPNTHIACCTFMALLVKSSAIMATSQLGLLGLPTHTTAHMGIALTRLCVSMVSLTMACRI